MVGEPAGSAPTSLDAPMSSQLWAAACSVILVGGQPERRNHTTRGISTENLTQGTGDTGVEGLKRRKEDTRVAERSRLRGALHTPGPRKRSGLLNGRGLADEGPTELGARSRRSWGGWAGAGSVGRRRKQESGVTGATLMRQSRSLGGKGARDLPARRQSFGDRHRKRCCHCACHPTLPRPILQASQVSLPTVLTSRQPPSVKPRRATLAPRPLSARDAQLVPKLQMGRLRLSMKNFNHGQESTASRRRVGL